MKEITADQLRRRIENKEALNLIDVRENWEYDEFNIGARNIPMSLLMQQLEDLEELKEEEVIIHCKMGGRTMQAAAILEQSGFQNIVVYLGGMDEWRKLYDPMYQPPASKR